MYCCHGNQYSEMPGVLLEVSEMPGVLLNLQIKSYSYVIHTSIR